MTTDGESLVGARLTVDVTAVAHGGHCVARHDGRVLFVRHAIPGERVVARVTEGGGADRYLRADAVEVLEPSPDRVEPRCVVAGPGGCGGCDFQHVSVERQRRLLGEVVSEQLHRLAGLDLAVEVEAVPGDQDGLGWRTRVRFSATDDRRPGLRRHRSHQAVPVERCPIAVADLPSAAAVIADGAGSAESVASSTGDRVVVTDQTGELTVTEAAIGRRFVVGASDFWQVHPGAADTLVAAILDGVRPRAGELAWDLYGGVGLFGAALGEAVGPAGKVVSVESHRRASRHARANLADLPQVRCVTDSVERFVRSRAAQGRLDIVVLDPPRAGAGRRVIDAIVRRQPRVLAYVGCDPASLARDVGRLELSGYRLTSVRAFDIFPMTSHVECVALLVKSR